MKPITLTFCALCVFAFASGAFAGPETYTSSKEMKTTVAPAPCPQWYQDNEWNIGIWGAYAFGGDDHDTIRFNDLSLNDGETIHIDETIGDDAWGGGMDIKYFFHKYFGIGVEAYGLATDNNHHFDSAARNADIGLDDNGDDAVGAVKGTLTLRFPIGCSRFAPYIYGGGGALFGGTHDTYTLVGVKERFVRDSEDDVRALGQVGGGLEVRFTPHIGWITDVSWNFTEDDSFGMVRGGLNFAF